MTPQEKLHQQIEAAGFHIRGWRSGISDRDSGPLSVIATNDATGESHEVTVHTRGVPGELEALQELARQVGVGDV